MYTYILVVGSALFLSGISGYIFIYFKNRDTLDNQGKYRWFFDLLTHIPNADTGPLAHVLSGVALISGVSVIIALQVQDLVSTEIQISAVLSIAAFIASCVFATVSIWTLWQTRRISFETGYKAEDFLSLMRAIVGELQYLDESYRNVYNSIARPIHRVYLVTRQPLLGSITFAEQDIYEDFVSIFRRVRDHARTTANQPPSDYRFEFHIICGNTESILDFHNAYFGDNEGKTRLLSEEVEDELRRFEEAIPESATNFSITRVKEVPAVQFMIIGNKLFEFTMDTGNNATEIFNTQIITDSRYCKTYVEHFELMRRALSK